MNIRTHAVSLYGVKQREPFSKQLYTAGAYRSFGSMKRIGVLLPPPPRMGCSSLVGNPPAFRRVSPTVRRYQLIYSCVERGTVRVKCFAQEHNTMTRPGLEPGPFDPESGARANH